MQLYFRLSEERINMHFDKDSFKEIESKIEAIDFKFLEDTEKYESDSKKPKQTKHKDAILIGTAKLNHLSVNIGVMNFSSWAEARRLCRWRKITRLIENAIQNKFPLIIFTSSGGTYARRHLIINANGKNKCGASKIR